MILHPDRPPCPRFSTAVTGREALGVGLRLVCLAAIGLFGAAVLIGHLVPDPDHVTPPAGTHRDGDRNVATLIDPNRMTWGQSGSFLLDPETGRLESLTLPPESRLTEASLASWRDELGRTQMVGSRFDPSLGQIVLARVALPSGAVLDRVPLAHPLAGPPCWNPRRPGQVLLAALDGRLSQVSFGAGTPPRVRPVRWGVQPPGEGTILISNALWPGSPRLDGRILASLQYQAQAKGAGTPFTPARLWWLKLDDEGTTIIAAGRLDRDDPDPLETSRADEHEQNPTLATARDGSLAVAYLVHRNGQPGWTLRMAPIDTDPHDGTPYLTAARIVSLVEDCANVPPGISADGRWLTCVVRLDNGPATVWRGNLDSLLVPLLLAHGEEGL